MSAVNHTPYVDGVTRYKNPTDMSAPLAELDAAIGVAKNIMISCVGDVTFDNVSGQLAWSAALIVVFNGSDGNRYYNSIAAGNVTPTDGQQLVTTLSETDGATITITAEAVTTDSVSTLVANNKLLLARRADNGGTAILWPSHLLNGFGLGATGVLVKNKYDATAAPTVDNDNTEGYSVGSDWGDVANKNTYQCIDSSTGAAVWKQTNAITVGSEAAAATVGFDLSRYSVGDVTLDQDTTINLTGGKDGQQILLRIRQDATGTRVVTWGAMCRFSSSLASPTLTTDADALDYIAFRYNAANSKYDCMATNLGF